MLDSLTGWIGTKAVPILGTVCVVLAITQLLSVNYIFELKSDLGKQELLVASKDDKILELIAKMERERESANRLNNATDAVDRAFKDLETQIGDIYDGNKDPLDKTASDTVDDAVTRILCEAGLASDDACADILARPPVSGSTNGESPRLQ